MRSLFAINLGMVLMFQAITSGASVLESLVMPGPVVQGHAEFEADCDKCHRAFQKGRQNDLCLLCHEDIEKAIVRQRGFHGVIPNVSSVECKHCHADHKGRDADIVALDPDTFDHGMTEFLLEGAHLTVACASCHDPGKKYREAPSRCVTCHKNDEPHKGRLGERCESCHDVSAWSSTRFDHGKTDFPLHDKHRDVRCEQCHINERYDGTPATCIGCHILNDSHAGRRGDRCGSCHTPAGWKETSFDHDAKTEFPLAGRHRDIRCGACHGGNFQDDTKGKTCIACHENDDEHRGRNGERCDQCHKPLGWEDLSFDHNTDTRFALRGSHVDISCESCHVGHVFKDKLESTCYACHKFDDVHKGQQGERCESCHNEQTWGGKVFFDHDLTRFPLIGLHAVAPCEECHISAAYKDTSGACVDCHRDDDEHRQRLGPQCGRCHNPNGWALWVFDHDRQTDYSLEGAHKGLACVGCHRLPVKTEIRQSTSCGSCHKEDDVHGGRFGRRCDRCHTTEDFGQIELR